MILVWSGSAGPGNAELERGMISVDSGREDKERTSGADSHEDVDVL